ncbi:DUF1326 domain-containing protein [Algicella marina]|uniref:DUF1326 domain-containing protein n=1 Tax=Algicella marina TaxID=2683284 RepID=A0A6P1T148_9RHOB|nr:DUF1326 domain-containing protein [Algicella marina]QHQ35461.1 DUF1326 domain-containing protein [Algicella marina]
MTERLRARTRIDSRLPGTRPEQGPGTEWAIKGELFLNCSCEVFCPCVISLGAHPPTEGHCHAWMAIAVDSGHYGTVDLSGINIGLLADIPGRMGEGNWKVALYVDDTASFAAFDAVAQILSGKAGGTTGLLSMLIGEVIGAERTSVVIERDGGTRRITVGRKLQGEIEQVLGHEGQPVVVKNTRYWMGPDIFVARGTKSRLRDKGRVWDFGGKSAEICPIDWRGPDR